MSQFKDVIYAAGTGIKVMSIFGLIAGMFLLIIYIRCPLKRVHGYRCFFLLTAVQDIVLAWCCLFLTPVTITNDFTGVIVATGMFRVQPLGEPLLMIFGSAFIFSLLIITNSFLYRYIHLCHADFVLKITSHKFCWNSIVLLINFLIILNWLLLMIYSSSRDEQFLQVWDPIVFNDTGIKLDDTAYFGYKVKHVEFLTPFVLLIENWVVLFLLLGANCYCSSRIVHTLRKATLNKQRKKHHKQMFLLLLLQASSPAIFMYLPMGFMYLMLFSGTRSTVVMTTIAASLFSFFPVIDPIIPIIFLREYREYVRDTWYVISPARLSSHSTRRMHFPT
ncbi:hypothetical protein V3C99_013187 [Haemonchus contortus]